MQRGAWVQGWWGLDGSGDDGVSSSLDGDVDLDLDFGFGFEFDFDLDGFCGVPR